MTIPELGYGLGLRTPHWDEILETQPSEVEWFEIISENFMDHHGHARHVLEKIRAHYPIAMHGVSLSIGSADAINHNYLIKLKALADWLEPCWVSDHICWTGINHKNTHDLLPVPYTEDALANMIDKVKQVQDILGRQLVLENPSNYMEFASNQMSEVEFIVRLLEAADCLLLLDVNNVYVTAFNHRLDAKAYIDAMPSGCIAQVHMAGHEHKGNHIVDTHDGKPTDDVLSLYRHTINTHGAKNTMLEWDANIPEFSVMLETLREIKSATEHALPNMQVKSPQPADASEPYDALMHRFQDHVLDPYDTTPPPNEWIIEKDNFSAKEQLNVYQIGYRLRLFDTLIEAFPATRKAATQDTFDRLVRTYIEQTPSTFYSIDDYIDNALPFFKEYLSAAHFALATLELAIRTIQTQMQPEATTLQELGTIAPEAFLSVSLSLLPSSQILAFAHNVYDAYGAYLQGDEIHKIVNTSCYVLIHCVGDDVFRQLISEEEYRLLSVVNNASSLEAALQTLHTEHHVEQAALVPLLQENLQRSIPQGIWQIG